MPIVVPFPVDDAIVAQQSAYMPHYGDVAREISDKIHAELGTGYVIAGSGPLAMVLYALHNGENVTGITPGTVPKIRATMPGDIDVFTNYTFEQMKAVFPELRLDGRNYFKESLLITAGFILPDSIKVQVVFIGAGVDPVTDCERDFDADPCCAYFNYTGLFVGLRAAFAIQKGAFHLSTNCRARLSRMHKYAQRGWTVSFDTKALPRFEGFEYVTPENTVVYRVAQRYSIYIDTILLKHFDDTNIHECMGVRTNKTIMIRSALTRPCLKVYRYTMCNLSGFCLNRFTATDTAESDTTSAWPAAASAEPVAVSAPRREPTFANGNYVFVDCDLDGAILEATEITLKACRGRIRRICCKRLSLKIQCGDMFIGELETNDVLAKYCSDLRVHVRELVTCPTISDNNAYVTILTGGVPMEILDPLDM